MAHGNRHVSIEALTGYQNIGPKKIVGGPSGAGSYPDTPERTLVKMTDPHIENPIIPPRLYPGPDSTDGKASLVSAEAGSGRS